jgi:hypothetical protein
MGRKVPFRCSVRLHCRLLRPFSDSFRAKFAQPSFYAFGCMGTRAMLARPRSIVPGRVPPLAFLCLST